jgi:hypothetical protein
MKIQIDLKSAVVGLLIGAAAMFVVGAETSPNQNGRFQVAIASSQIENAGAVAVIVDTQTGQAWGVTARANWHDDAGKFWDAK